MTATQAAAVLLAAFTAIEACSRNPLVPVRLLADRNRTAAYLVTLCLGTALLGMFFFLTLFMQVIRGYSALRTGLAYLPERELAWLARGQPPSSCPGSVSAGYWLAAAWRRQAA